MFTKHAKTRAQQRGIPDSPFIFDLLARFGRSAPAGDGAECLYLDRPARRHMRRYLGGRVFARIESLIDDAYVVENGGHALTIGHRTRRIPRR